MLDTSDVSRRSFLKGAASAGVAVAGGLSLARSAHAAGGDVIRVGLVGCGGRGSGAAANCLNVKDNIKLVAMADAFEDKARFARKVLKQKYGEQVDVPDERLFVGLDAYEQAIDAGVDLVLLATPPGFRPMQYKAAVEAGKNVFLEKPICIDAPGYRSVIETNKLADQKNLKVAVGLQRRHAPGIIETIKRIHDGAIGKIHLLRAYRNGGGLWVRPRQQLAKVLGREPTEMEYQVFNWYYFVWTCGDQINEMHVHSLDAINWAMRDQHPIQANGMGGRQVRKGKDYGQIHDHAFVEFTYPGDIKFYSQNRQIAGCWDVFEQLADGTLGTSNCISEIVGGPNAWKYRGQKEEAAYDLEHVDLLRAIRNNTPYNEGYYGANSSFTAVLGRMAAYSGQKITWDDAVARGRSEMPKRLAWDADPQVLPDKDGSYEHAVAMPGIYDPFEKQT